MGFHWCSNDCKSPQVPGTLFSIPTKLSNAVVWMVSICPLISKSFSPCTNPLVTVRIVPITIGVSVTFMFHCFFHFTCKVKALIFLFVFFQFYSVVHRDNKVYNSANYHFTLLRVFFLYTSVSWGSFTGVWGAASLLKSPGPFSVFWPILKLL